MLNKVCFFSFELFGGGGGAEDRINDKGGDPKKSGDLIKFIIPGGDTLKNQ